jgi:hypothetical protein
MKHGYAFSRVCNKNNKNVAIVIDFIGPVGSKTPFESWLQPSLQHLFEQVRLCCTHPYGEIVRLQEDIQPRHGARTRIQATYKHGDKRKQSLTGPARSLFNQIGPM